METNNNNNQRKEEATYTKVQFIGLCLSTTPGNLTSIEGMSDDGRYLGKSTAREDIYARITIVKTLLEVASGKVKKDPSTLNVFVLPEFFFRGSTGAYLRGAGQTAYEFFTQEFASLIMYMKSNQYENCLLVAGSVLSSEIDFRENEKTEPGKSLRETGSNLLNVYYRLHPKSGDGTEGNNHPSMHEMLKMIDEGINDDLDKLSTEDAAFVDVLRRTLDNCDDTTNLVVDNSAYVIFGGKYAPAPKRIPKKYKSKEDFVLNRYYMSRLGPARTGYLQSNTKYAPIDGSELKDKDFDTGAIFYYGGIWFGIDICLDHSRQRLVDELRRESDHFVDVQIITSCGMSIRENAVTAKEGNWVFNCDGEYQLGKKELGIDGDNCHTSLRKVTSQLRFDKEGNVINAGLSVAEEGLFVKEIELKDLNKFYPTKSYHLHIYAPHSVHK